jgi:hypothetical protein
MQKKLIISLIAVVASSLICAAQSRDAGKPSAPASVTVEIVLADAPGINVDDSRWEINYELSMVTHELLIASIKGKEEEPRGDLIKQGSFKSSLKSIENRKVSLTIPLDEEMQNRLRNQPPTPNPATLTAQQSRDYEKVAQNFAFRAVVEIYDGRLRKNVIVPVHGMWGYETFPDARFPIQIKIKAEDTFEVAYPKPPKNGQEKIIKHQ